MNPLTVEWINKAEGDFRTTQREYRARKWPNYDAVCFHAQNVDTVLKVKTALTVLLVVWASYLLTMGTIISVLSVAPRLRGKCIKKWCSPRPLHILALR